MKQPCLAKFTITDVSFLRTTSIIYPEVKEDNKQGLSKWAHPDVNWENVDGVEARLVAEVADQLADRSRTLCLVVDLKEEIWIYILQVFGGYCHESIIQFKNGAKKLVFKRGIRSTFNP